MYREKDLTLFLGIELYDTTSPTRDRYVRYLNSLTLRDHVRSTISTWVSLCWRPCCDVHASELDVHGQVVP